MDARGRRLRILLIAEVAGAVLTVVILEHVLRGKLEDWLVNTVVVAALVASLIAIVVLQKVLTARRD